MSEVSDCSWPSLGGPQDPRCSVLVCLLLIQVLSQEVTHVFQPCYSIDNQLLVMDFVLDKETNVCVPA